jgi:hypothetical protein
MTASLRSGQAFIDAFRGPKGTIDYRKVLAASQFPVYCIQHRAFTFRSPDFGYSSEEGAPWRIDDVRFQYVAPDLFNVEKDVLVANSRGGPGSPAFYGIGLKRVLAKLQAMVQRDRAPSAAAFPHNLGALSEFWYHSEHGPTTEAMQYLSGMPWRHIEIVGLSFEWLGWNEPAPFFLAQHGTDLGALVIGAVGVTDTLMLEALASLVRVDNNTELANKLHADLEAALEAIMAKHSPHNGN